MVGDGMVYAGPFRPAKSGALRTLSTGIPSSFLRLGQAAGGQGFEERQLLIVMNLWNCRSEIMRILRKKSEPYGPPGQRPNWCIWRTRDQCGDTLSVAR